MLSNSSLCFRRKFFCCRAICSMIFLLFSAASCALELVSADWSRAGSTVLGLSVASADVEECYIKLSTLHRQAQGIHLPVYMSLSLTRMHAHTHSSDTQHKHTGWVIWTSCLQLLFTSAAGLFSLLLGCLGHASSRPTNTAGLRLALPSI